jgi:hypothetical protein
MVTNLTKRIFAGALVAAATGALSWVWSRWLDRRAAGSASRHRPPIESWENEGGALAPHSIPVETSQVPR